MSNRRPSRTPRRTTLDLWSSVAHDLRQPVQAIALLAKLISAEQAQRELGERLGLLTVSIDFMIEALSDIAALQQGTRAAAVRPVSLQRMAAAARTRQGKAAEAAGRQVRLHPGEATVASDPRLVAAILDGLLLYVIKHATDVEIEMGVRGLSKLASLDIVYGGPDPQFALRKQAFVDLRPLPDSPSEPVIGLGLMLAARLAHLLGGRIEHGRLARRGRHRLSLKLPLGRS